MSKQIPLEKNIVFKNQEEVAEYAAKQNRILLMYDTYVLDATSFAKHHPGGAGLILNYKSKNIDAEMKSHHELSLIMANTMVIGTYQKDIERIINPDQALLPQVWKLDHEQYMKLINSPHWLFRDSPKMFESDFMEPLSHNRWNRIFLLPLIVMAIYINRVDWTELYTTYPILFVLCSLLGFFSFTLTEYLLHRFIFHSEKYLPDFKLVRYLHFILHGIHHMLPIDPNRLVYPPSLAFITMVIGYYTVYPLVNLGSEPATFFFWAGFILGYWTYDLTHYALHHIDTSKNKGGYFHRLQQYHNQHHFGGQQLGFGVSSKFWDIVFRTQMSKKIVH